MKEDILQAAEALTERMNASSVPPSLVAAIIMQVELHLKNRNNDSYWTPTRTPSTGPQQPVIGIMKAIYERSNMSYCPKYRPFDGRWQDRECNRMFTIKQGTSVQWLIPNAEIMEEVDTYVWQAARYPYTAAALCRVWGQDIIRIVYGEEGAHDPITAKIAQSKTETWMEAY